MLFSEEFSNVLSFIVAGQINVIFEILYPIFISNYDNFIVWDKVKRLSLT